MRLDFLLFVVLTSATILIVTSENLAKPCSDQICKPPDCRCSSPRVPGGLHAENVPQFVMLTFDDSINPNVYKYYSSIFGHGRKNPDGCPIRGTFFVTHEWNDYWLTRALYAQGHEIADHSVTHESTEAFKTADLDRWVKEIGGMKKILELFGQVRRNDVKGFRAPFLQAGGDLMFKAIEMAGLTYDTSLPASENNPPLWPYTLDYKSTQECKIGPCPVEPHPGIWEVPMIYYNDKFKSVCAMIDACRDNFTYTSSLSMLEDNFMRHYLSNRAPFPMFMHAGWFTNDHFRQDALRDFLDMVLSLPDVYFVTVSDVIDWIKDPVPCKPEKDEEGHIKCRLRPKGQRFCDNKQRGKPCPRGSSNTCRGMYRVVDGQRGSRKFSTCFECPEEYPWLGIPDGNIYKHLNMTVPKQDRMYYSGERGLRLNTPKKEKKPKRVFSKSKAKQRLLRLLENQLGNRDADKNILAKVLGEEFYRRKLEERKSQRVP